MVTAMMAPLRSSLGPLLPLILRQLRLRRGQVITLAVLTCVAAALLNTALTLSATYMRDLDDRAVAEQAPDETFVVLPLTAPGDQSAQVATLRTAVEEELQVVRSAAEPLRSDVIDAESALVSLDLNGEELPITVTVFDRAQHPQIGERTVIAQSPTPYDNAIWAPALLQYAGAYQLGDEITLSTSEGSTTFRIQGFYEDLYGASTNMGMLYFAVDGPPQGTLAGAQPVLVVNGRSDSDTYAQLSGAVERASARSSVPATVLWSASIDVLTGGSAALGPELLTLVLLVLTAAIVLVALVTMRFVIANLITRDMAALGVLRATGCTTGQIIGHIVLVFAGAALLASLLGLLLSQPLLGAVAGAIAGQSGLAWRAPVAVGPMLLTVLLLTGAVLLLALLGALRTRAVTTVAALRGGTSTHSGQRDVLPLSTTPGPLPVLMGVTAMLRSTAQSTLMLVTVTVLTAAPVLALGMSLAVGAEQEEFGRQIVGDVGDVTVVLAPGSDAQAVQETMRATDGVVDPYVVSWDGRMVEGFPLVVSVLDDYAVWDDEVLAEGRFPRHPDELMVGASTAREEGLEVGDVHTVELDTGSAEFVVTGILSTGRNLGLTLSVTTEGMERLDPHHQPGMIAARVEPGATVDQVVEDLRARLGADARLVESSKESVTAMLGGYLTMISAMSTAIVVLSVGAVALVAALMVTTMVLQARRAHGVQKALGFTTQDLLVQTLWTYLPVVMVGALLGAAAGVLGLEPLMSTLLARTGVVRMDLAPSPLVGLVAAAGMVLLVTVVTLLAALRLRRVSPYELMLD